MKKSVRWLLVWFCALLPLVVKALPDNAYVAVNIPKSSTTSLNGIADYIKDNYKGAEAQLWALYSWEASYVRYNIEKRNVQLSITDADALALWTVKHREGVCANFASLFYAVAKRLGVECYLVGGYSVMHNNVRDDGHEWCACIVDGKPYLFDPTWGGGYMLNDAQYVHHLNADFFMVEPEKMVRTHMPEDPLFQFLNYPHFYDDIDNPGSVHPIPVYFNWRDSLGVYNKQDSLARLGGQLARMRANGFANDWIKSEISRLQHNYEAYLLNRQVDAFNNCVTGYQSLYFQVTKKVKKHPNWQSEMQSLQSQLSDIIEVLDNTEFSVDSLTKGAADVQKQAVQLLEELPKLEAALKNSN